MQLPYLLLVALAASTPTLALPASSISMTASTPQWTIKSFRRVCNAAEASCAYSYSIDTHVSPIRACSYTITGNTASRASYGNIKCGGYTVSSSWSGQFGQGKGFQTLAMTNGRVIVYPAYTDKQLVGGKVVSPDQSYQPQNLP